MNSIYERILALKITDLMRDVNSYSGKEMEKNCIYTFSDAFFIRETAATSVLFGTRLSKISIR